MLMMQDNLVKNVLSLASKRLTSISDSARLDAEVLLCHTLNWSRTKIFIAEDQQLSDEELNQFNAAIERRVKGEPIAYITGEQEFWSLPFKVNAATLIPRPETEHLVEQALLKIPANEKQSVLDLGTGSGAVVIAIASERPLCKCVAVDSSDAALQMANVNAQNLGFKNVSFLQSNWFSALTGQKYDVIASNPPYIEEQDPHLQQGDVVFEPRSALISGVDGLDDIRLICSQAKTHLFQQGWLMLEHGWQQAKDVRQIFKDNGFMQVESINDLAGIERLTIGCFEQKSE